MTVLLIVTMIVVLVGLLVLGQLVSFWIQAVVSDAGVGLVDILRMRLKGDDVRAIILTRIRLSRAGADVPLDRLIAHDRAGGNLPACATAIIGARAGGRLLPWDPVAEADLAGLDVAALTAEALGRARPRQDKSDLEVVFVSAVAQAAPGRPPAQAPAAAGASRG